MLDVSCSFLFLFPVVQLRELVSSFATTAKMATEKKYNLFNNTAYSVKKKKRKTLPVLCLYFEEVVSSRGRAVKKQQMLERAITNVCERECEKKRERVSCALVCLLLLASESRLQQSRANRDRV